jgi:enamine deaminase RidA (YjgF/YER057c/UK114 family)
MRTPSAGLHLLLLVALAGTPTLAAAQSRPDTVRITNPPTLSTPRGYSHVVEVPAGSRMVYVAGQVALDSTGQLVGAGDFRAQTVQVFENLRRALAAAGATFDDVVKLNYYLLDVAQLPVLREVRDRYVNVATPPASTLIEVRRLFRPDVMVEVEATAVARRR